MQPSFGLLLYPFKTNVFRGLLESALSVCLSVYKIQISVKVLAGL